jgi:demethylmenaquinone methyltransferase / 2-methoxy-6-polyprenyl-1,4-benzoquinol methylase
VISVRDQAARSVHLPRGEQKRRDVERMFDRIAPRYDRLNRIISLGQDRRWRRRTVESLQLAPGATALDLGCGTGDLCDDLGRAGFRAIGIDFSAGMLSAAHTRAPLVRADALRVPLPDGSADGVVTGFALRNFTDLAAFFHECARVLRRGGRLAALDASEPTNPVLRAGHDLWFRRLVPRIGAVLSHDADAYRYLPRSTAYLPAVGELMALLSDAGFADVQRATFTGGAVQLVTGTRR